MRVSCLRFDDRRVQEEGKQCVGGVDITADGTQSFSVQESVALEGEQLTDDCCTKFGCAVWCVVVESLSGTVQIDHRFISTCQSTNV